MLKPKSILDQLEKVKEMTDCAWCGNYGEVVPVPFVEQGGGVEYLCDTCLTESFKCAICTDLSHPTIFGYLHDEQARDICSDCQTNIDSATRICEGTICPCGKNIDVTNAVTGFGLPICPECADMFNTYFSQQEMED